MGEASLFPLEARALGVRLGEFVALQDVSFRLEAGLRTVVLGANGAGKTILMRTLHGLLIPSQGTVTWGGSTSRPREQALVFQRPVLLRRSVIANVAYALAVHGARGEERERRARSALDRAGLAHLADRQARVLSGGEQQRLALARAWALEPRVLFLDEPTASLDPAAAREVERLIQEFHGAGTRIVMTTHNLGLARRVADEIVFLQNGRLAEHSPADVFFAHPRSPEAAAFLKEELP